MRLEIGARQPEYAAPALLELEPDERQAGEGVLEPLVAVADLDEERSVRLEVIGRAGEDAPGDVQTVGTGAQGELWFVKVFARQFRHLGVAHIGRVRDDHIVAAPRHRTVQVALEQLYAVGDMVAGDIAARELERRRRNVHRVDAAPWQHVGAGNRDAPGPCPEIEHATDSRSVDPGSELRKDQLGERRARHDRARVDLEFEPREPHPSHQVGGGHATLDALGKHREHRFATSRAGPRVVGLGGPLVLESEHVEDDRRGLIVRRAGAVAVCEPRVLELRRAMADELRHARIRRQTCCESLGSGHGVRGRCGIIAAPSDQISAQLRMAARPFLIGVFAIVAFAAGVFLARGWQMRSTEAPEHATAFPTPLALPAVSLIDQDGHPLDATFFEDGWTLVFFGFTRCPGICPTTLATLARTKAALDDLPPAQRPRVLLVSVDPEYDTPPVLAEYVRSFDPSFLAATGDPAAVASVASEFGVAYAKTALSPDSYGVDHGAGIFLVAPDGIAAFSSAPHEAEVLARDYRRVLARHGTHR